MKKEKIYTRTIFILVIIILILLLLFLLFANGSIMIHRNNNTNNNSNTDIEHNKESENTLDKLIGEWGMCNGDIECFGVIISKNDNQEYTYVPYQMWTDGFKSGIVKENTLLENNQLELIIYYEEYESELSYTNEHTDKYVIDFSKISSNIITINGVMYKKILVDRDAFFDSITG